MPASGGIFRLSPLAEADLEGIWLYTRDNWSVQQADRYHGDIMNVLDDLTAGRRIGRRVDIRESYLKYPSGPHFLFYRIADGGIDVIRILHKKMDVSRHL